MVNVGSEIDGASEGDSGHEDELTPLVPATTPATKGGFFEYLRSPFAVDRNLVWIFVPVLLGNFIDFGDGAIFRTVNVQVGSDLGNPFEMAILLITNEAITTSAQPLYSLAKDGCGWQMPLLFAYVVFIVGQLFTGVYGSSFTSLCIGRSITAVGSAGMVFVLTLVLNDIIDPRKITNWVALETFVGLLGQLTGSYFAASVKAVDELQRLFLWQLGLPVLTIIVMARKLPARTRSDDYTSSQMLRVRNPDNTRSFALSQSLLALSSGLIVAGASLWAKKVEFILWVKIVIPSLGITSLLILGWQEWRSSTVARLWPKLEVDERYSLCVAFCVRFLVNSIRSASLFILPWLANAVDGSSTWFLWPFWVGEFFGFTFVAIYTTLQDKVKPALTLGALVCSVTSIILYIWFSKFLELPMGQSYRAFGALIWMLGVSSSVIVAGLRPLVLSTLEEKSEYKARVWTLFNLMATTAGPILTLVCNELIQSFGTAQSLVGLCNGCIREMDKQNLGHAYYDKYKRRLKGEETVSTESLSSVTCLIMVLSILTLLVILGAVVDIRLRNRSESSSDADRLNARPEGGE